MKRDVKIVAAVLMAVLAAGGAETAKAPMDWVPVQTNAILRWKSANRAPDGVVVDTAARSVRFLVEATGVETNEVVEFFAIGPLSDRAYESLFVTVASPAAIAAGLDAIGVPRGVGADPFAARLWPQGERLTVKLGAVAGGTVPQAFPAAVLRDVRAAEEGDACATPILWTGGQRDAQGMPVAATNMPCAVFALYNHGPSLLQFGGQFDQTGTYGRFVAASRLVRGTLFEVTAAWDGTVRAKDVVVELSATNGSQKLALLKEAVRGHDVYVRLAFDASVTVERAARYAQAFALLDGEGLRMNGQAEGQFYFRAFLPDPAWRERPGRIFQPFEVHLAADGTRTFVFCEEDFSGEGMDPVLKPKTTPFKAWSELPGLIAKTGEQGGKVNVLFLFAPKTTPVTALTPIVKAVGARVATYYVFGE